MMSTAIVIIECKVTGALISGDSILIIRTKDIKVLELALLSSFLED